MKTGFFYLKQAFNYETFLSQGEENLKETVLFQLEDRLELEMKGECVSKYHIDPFVFPVEYNKTKHIYEITTGALITLNDPKDAKTKEDFINPYCFQLIELNHLDKIEFAELLDSSPFGGFDRIIKPEATVPIVTKRYKKNYLKNEYFEFEVYVLYK